MKVPISRLLAIPILISLGASLAAQVETTHFQATGGGDRFAYDVALRDDVLIAGAMEDDQAGLNAGAVYVYYWDEAGTPGFGFDDQWIQLQKLIPADLVAGDALGTRVDVFGDLVVASAVCRNEAYPDSGAVYVYQRDRLATSDPLDDVWIQLDKLLPSSSYAGQRFGQEVAIHGGTIAVSVRDDDDTVNDEKVFLFERDDMGTPADFWDDQWIETAVIPATTRSRFGWGLDLTADTLFVGARWHDESAGQDDSGAVFVYFRNDRGTPFDRLDDTWFDGPMLTANPCTVGAQFGCSVEAAEDTLLVGAWKAYGTGAAYVFERDRKGTDSPFDDEWVSTDLLRPSDGRYGDGFGNGLSLNSDVSVIGSLGFDMLGQKSLGKLYVFERDQLGTPLDPFDDEWPEEARLMCSQTQSGDQTASRLTAWGGLAVVGSIKCEAAHVFDLDGLLKLHVETTDDWTTPLANGRVVKTAPDFGRWLNIEGLSASGLQAAAFDSSLTGPNLFGPDPDLLVGTGNVLILQQDATMTIPGIYDVPNDDACGGILDIEFLEGVATPLSVNLIDIDPVPNQDVKLTLFDRAGGTRTFIVPSGWTEDLMIDGPPGYRTLDLTTLDPQPGFLSTATAIQTPFFRPEEVERMRVLFHGSGALDDLRWCIDGSTLDRAHRPKIRARVMGP